MPPQTASQQAMQQPQSGPPSTTGGYGAGVRGPLPQSPGSGTDQAGSKSLAALVDKVMQTLQAGSDQLQAALSELRIAAVHADEELKQTGNPQYPAAPPATQMHPEAPEAQ